MLQHTVEEVGFSTKLITEMYSTSIKGDEQQAKNYVQPWRV